MSTLQPDHISICWKHGTADRSYDGMPSYVIHAAYSNRTMCGLDLNKGIWDGAGDTLKDRLPSCERCRKSLRKVFDLASLKPHRR